jgi:integrase
MARTTNRLTDAVIRRATKPGMLADGSGLYLRVSPSGTRAWIYRFRQDGKLHDLGLGSFSVVNLANARRRAQQMREQRLDGLDPLAAKREKQSAIKLAAAKTMTFRDAATAYVAAHETSWRSEKHRAQWSGSLANYALPVLGDLPVDAIDLALVLRVIEPLWTTKPETASRLRGRVENILDWAAVRGYRQGDNPARWRGHLESLLPALSKAKWAVRQKQGRAEHFAALPYAELPSFMAALRQHRGGGARALEFLILMGGRTGEILGARWDEIDVANRLWTIPAARMKTGREHRVPLSDAALVIIEAMAQRRAAIAAHRRNDFIFPGTRANRPLSDAALIKTLKYMGRSDLTVHGFRSTFADWAAETTNFPHEVRELALAHKVGSAVEQAYRRGDLFEKRRQLTVAWAAFCDGGAAVVPFRTKSAQLA